MTPQDSGSPTSAHSLPRPIQPHTPGPWVDAGDRGIETHGVADSVFVLGHAFKPADRRLIATSPELLNALERKAIAYHAHMLHMAPFADCMVPTCAGDRDLIARAKGGAA